MKTIFLILNSHYTPINQLLQPLCLFGHVEVAHDGLETCGHLVGNDVSIFSLGIGVGISAPLVDFLLFFCQQVFFQQERHQHGLGLGGYIVGGQAVELVGLGLPLKNQMAADIHGVDRIPFKSQGNAIDEIDIHCISHGSTSPHPWYPRV